MCLALPSSAPLFSVQLSPLFYVSPSALRKKKPMGPLHGFHARNLDVQVVQPRQELHSCPKDPHNARADSPAQAFQKCFSPSASLRKNNTQPAHVASMVPNFWVWYRCVQAMLDPSPGCPLTVLLDIAKRNSGGQSLEICALIGPGCTHDPLVSAATREPV